MLAWLDGLPLAWLVPAVLGTGLVSAVVPWINAELLLLACVPLAGSGTELAALVCAMTVGQMTGKSTLYWLTRRATGDRGARLRQLAELWRQRLGERKRPAVALVAASAIFGIPPFYLVSIAAGACRVSFGWFLTAGLSGRLLHFAAVAYAPHLLWRGL